MDFAIEPCSCTKGPALSEPPGRQTPTEDTPPVSQSPDVGHRGGHFRFRALLTIYHHSVSLFGLGTASSSDFQVSIQDSKTPNLLVANSQYRNITTTRIAGHHRHFANPPKALRAPPAVRRSIPLYCCTAVPLYCWIALTSSSIIAHPSPPPPPSSPTQQPSLSIDRSVSRPSLTQPSLPAAAPCQHAIAHSLTIGRQASPVLDARGATI